MTPIDGVSCARVPELPTFSLEVLRDEDPVRVAVAGELDLVTAPEFRAAVGEQLAGGRVLLDLRGVEFMDSSGVTALDALLKQAAAEDGELLVHPGIPDAVARVLEMTGMLDALRLHDGQGSA